jgi:hypothetical protein
MQRLRTPAKAKTVTMQARRDPFRSCRFGFVQRSARARATISRLVRTPSGTRTFFDAGDQIAVK